MKRFGLITLLSVLCVLPACLAARADTGQSMARAGMRNLEAGRFDDAQSNFLLALEMGRDTADKLAQGLAWLGMGALDIERGNFTPAFDALERAVELLNGDTPEQRAARAEALAKTALALILTDNPDKAAAYLDQADAIATADNLVPLRLEILCLRARALQALGQYPQARALLESVLEQYGRVFGPLHPGTAATHLLLGALFEAMDMFIPAQEHYVTAMHIYERIYGSKHPATARAYAAVGRHAVLTGDYAFGAQMLQKAMDVQEVAVGRWSPDYADTSAALGLLYLDTAQYDHAQTALEHALDVDSKLFGEHSLRAARDYADLAKVFLGQMQLSAATEAAQKAQMIYALLLPSNHPELAAALNNLAVVYYYAGDYEIANELQQAALRADAASFAPATTEASVAHFNNLGTLEAMLDPSNPNAVEYYNQAIIAETAITDGDPVRLASLYVNLGLTYENTGDFEHAAAAYENAVKQTRWALGVENQLTAEAYRNLARCRFKMGDMAEAERNYKYFLKITYPLDEHADHVIRMLKDFERWRASESGPQYLPRYLGPEPDPFTRPRYLGHE